MVNFVQLLKAYNVFNNNGIAVTPKIADVKTNSKRVLSAKVANEMLMILRKIKEFLLNYLIDLLMIDILFSLEKVKDFGELHQKKLLNIS